MTAPFDPRGFHPADEGAGPLPLRRGQRPVPEQLDDDRAGVERAAVADPADACDLVSGNFASCWHRAAANVISFEPLSMCGPCARAFVTLLSGVPMDPPLVWTRAWELPAYAPEVAA